jgi:hypothetical protein
MTDNPIIEALKQHCGVIYRCPKCGERVWDDDDYSEVEVDGRMERFHDEGPTLESEECADWKEALKESQAETEAAQLIVDSTKKALEEAERRIQLLEKGFKRNNETVSSLEEFVTECIGGESPELFKRVSELESKLEASEVEKDYLKELCLRAGQKLATCPWGHRSVEGTKKFSDLIFELNAAGKGEKKEELSTPPFHFPKDWCIRKAKEEEGCPNNMGFADWENAIKPTSLIPCLLCGSEADLTPSGTVGCAGRGSLGCSCKNIFADIQPEAWNVLNAKKDGDDD